MNAHLTRLVLAAGDQPANTPAPGTATFPTVDISVGVAVFLVALFLIKVGTGRAGWVLMAVAGVMLAGTEMGSLVAQFGAQLATAGATALDSLFS